MSKGGSLAECDNYRPISILPNVSKVSEFFANLNLMQYAQQFDLIGKHQFAYARNSSTTVALIKAVDSWKMAIDSGEKVVSAFLDLRKAFDIIDHNTLLNKMRNNGVTGIELKWFNSHLKERYQYVSCGGEESSKRSISHGVPQGSILGPTLFNIHVNDICKVCRNTNVFLYADDTELHATSSEINIAERLVNEDLTNIANWWRQNGLISNHKKCEVMLIGSRHTTTTSRDLEISLDGNLLKQTNSVKYLGVNIDHNLSWNTHVHAISRRVYPRLKLLNRISKYLTRSVLLRIYKQTILPLMDYGCIVWGDCGKQNAQYLERLQNQAMRIILSANHKTCTQHMRSKLTLLSLSSRRRFLRLQLVFKIINNIDCPRQLKGYLVKRSELCDRNFRDSSLIDGVRAKTALGQSSFKSAASREWNSLPRHLRDITSMQTFKSKLFNYFLNLDVSSHVCSVS